VSPTGKWIVTDHVVMVRESLKGTLAPGREIVVELRGGRVTFDDGTSAETQPLGFEFKHPIPGDNVLLYLRALRGVEAPHPSIAEEKDLPVMGATLAYYVFVLSNIAEPCFSTNPEAGLFKGLRGQPASTFMEMVRRSIDTALSF
jgi:hypothetical protein